MATTLTAAYKTQNTYKEPLDIKDRVLGWRLVLEDELSMGQVLAGIRMHMKRSPNMPTPADVNNLVNAEPKEVTTAEYIHAKNQWKLNGYPRFCNHRDVVKAYEDQSTRKIESPSLGGGLNKIIGESIKKIK